MEIQTVKETEGGYLVNGTMSVPKAEGNRHYAMVKEWLDAGNTPEPQFTEEELFEQKASEVRAQRNALLAECDFILMPDFPLNDKSMWEQYRQDLRDVTEQSGYPDVVIWPEKPYLP